MGIGINNGFKSNSIEYSTPQKLFDFLDMEFHFDLDVCASPKNAKCEKYYTKEQNSLDLEWSGICWMNPPFNKELKKWVLKARQEVQKRNCLVCCLIPVRSNTIWWKNVCQEAEIRFIIGEVNFNDLDRGLWLPMCCMIFGGKNIGKFGIIDYKAIKKNIV